MHNSNFDPNIAAKTSLGTLLLDFLALYGIYFNYEKAGIDVKNERYFQKTGDPTRMHVIDPTNEENNVAQGSFNFVAVRNAFRTGFGALTSLSKKSPSLLSRIINISPELIKRRIYIIGDKNFQVPSHLINSNIVPNGRRKRKHKHKKESSKKKRKEE